MKSVLEHIELQSAKLASAPVFVHLRDASVDAVQRLQFVPCTTHFIMTFADLCRFVLPAVAPRDRYEAMANANLKEESDHWKWFLADLTSLGVDPQLRFTDAVRLLWNDATLESRRLSYEICKMSVGLDSLHKLVMVLCIEATGKVALESSIAAGREAASRLGRKLVYFGGQHLESELSHTLASDDVHEALREDQLDLETRASLIALADAIFAQFNRFVDDVFRFVKSGQNAFVEPQG